VLRAHRANARVDQIARAALDDDVLIDSALASARTIAAIHSANKQACELMPPLEYNRDDGNQRTRSRSATA
jgi:hypothetical protein